MNEIRARFDGIRDLALEDLAQTSDEQLRAELIEDGEDPDKVVADVRENLQKVVRDFMKGEEK